MKRSLRTYGNNNTPNKPKDAPKETQQPKGERNTPDNNQFQNPMDNLDANTANAFQSVLSQYGNKSEAELINELKRYQQSGMMDMQSLYDMANRIAPMLNQQQMQKLTQVIQQLSGQ